MQLLVVLQKTPQRLNTFCMGLVPSERFFLLGCSREGEEGGGGGVS